jgi:hypothetical protein
MKKTIKNNSTMLQKALKMAVLPVVAVTAFLSFSAFTGVGESAGNYKTPDLTTCYRDKDGKDVGWSNDCKSTTDKTASCVDGHCPTGTTESNNW